MKSRNAWIAALSVAVVLLTAIPARSADTKQAADPASNAYGQSFAEWQRDYWAWTYGGISEPPKNNVLFLPVPSPALTEDWNGKTIWIGTLDVTLKPGTKIVLGVLSWIGETYQDHNGVIGSHAPDDQPWGVEDFVPPLGEVEIVLDGKSLINADNVAQFYYGPIDFQKTIWYKEASSYGSTGIIWAQGIGVVLPPLSPGKHIMTLYSWDDWRGMYGPAGLGWYNTWIITVQQGNKK